MRGKISWNNDRVEKKYLSLNRNWTDSIGSKRYWWRHNSHLINTFLVFAPDLGFSNHLSWFWVHALHPVYTQTGRISRHPRCLESPNSHTRCTTLITCTRSLYNSIINFETRVPNPLFLSSFQAVWIGRMEKRDSHHYRSQSCSYQEGHW